MIDSEYKQCVQQNAIEQNVILNETFKAEQLTNTASNLTKQTKMN